MAHNQQAVAVAAAGIEVAQGRSCILCGSQTQEVLPGIMDTRFGAPGVYAIRRCSRCGLEQICPLPPPDELKKLYETYYNFGDERGTRYTEWREWFFSSWLYRSWLALDGDGSFHSRKGSGQLLDIGCNEGRGLKLYRRNGFEPEGLELNPRAAKVARAAGFVVHETLLENFDPQSRYDVVVLSNVLEHSLNPEQMLRDVARILKPDGEVWISCPNSQSWQRTLFGRCWINWHAPFHIVHFSDVTLKNVLGSTGFRNIRIQQISPALWLASSIIIWAFFQPDARTRYLRHPILLPGLLGAVRVLLFPLLWWGNHSGKGDCLIAIAAKDSRRPVSGPEIIRSVR